MYVTLDLGLYVILYDLHAHVHTRYFFLSIPCTGIQYLAFQFALLSPRWY